MERKKDNTLSQETKEQAAQTHVHLVAAEKQLQAAEKSANGTGDKTLIKQVETVRKSTEQIKKEIATKLGEKG